MNYPVNITLRKLNTLEDAIVQQKEKYPDGTERIGLMWEHSYPEVGEQFLVLASKLRPTFITSKITEIIKANENEIMFKTLNSTYVIEIWNSSK